MIRLERIVDALPADFDALRAAARAEGFGMLDVLAADWKAQKIRFDGDGEALVAGYSDDSLAGVGGMTLDPFTLGALRMRRFYVPVSYRRLGIGEAIAGALLARPATAGRIVTTNAAPGSEAFWESLGFIPARRERQTHVLAR
jgi:GNAT superfamily N-acetyltransferase